MDPAALEHAKDALQTAAEAVERLHDATVAEELDRVRREWSTFLMATTAIYNMLAGATKANGGSNAWFGRVKRERRTDELLRYVRHARNGRHHGIAEIVRAGETVLVEFPARGPFLPWSIEGTLNQGFNADNFWIKAKDTETGEEIEPSKIEFKTYLATVPVDDGGVTYHPPTSHLGVPIEIDEPLGIATLALEYLRGVIADAEKYVTR